MSAATWILCSKIVLVSTGVISIAMAVKFSVPSIMAFAFYELPTIWSTLVSWLKPPYLYFILNGIIITIAASSRFSRKAENSESQISVKTLPPAHIVAAAIPVRPMPEINLVKAPPQVAYEDDDKDESEANIVELKPVVVNGVIEAGENEAYDVLDEDYNLVTSRSTRSLPEADDDGDLVVSKSACPSSEMIIFPEAQLDYQVLPVENKPSGFGQRKPIKFNPEGGRAAKVARQKRHETLETTWKMITEGREPQLKKSDTFQNHGSHLNLSLSDDEDLLPQHPLKSETFRDRTNFAEAYDAPPAGAVPALGWPSNMGKIKKELSLSQDELNRRVEAFINKFNEDMRLQRQQSINQYMEMINRGAN